MTSHFLNARMTSRFLNARMTSRFLNDERGAALVEYALLLGVVCAVCVTAINLLAPGIQSEFTLLVEALDHFQDHF